MNYGEFMAFHRTHEPSRLYLLAGEENYFIKKAEKHLLSLLFPDGCQPEDIQLLGAGTGIPEIIGSIQSVPFFTDRNVIIVRDTDLFRERRGAADDEKKKKRSSSPEDELAELFGNMPDYSYVIFESGHKADKRFRLYKELAKYGKVLEAEPIRSWDIGDWLQGKLQELRLDMDREAFQYFTGMAGMMSSISLGYLDQELNKLAMFADRKRISRKLLVEVLSDIPEVSGFAMTDAISSHNVRKALFLFQRQLEEGVAMPLIVAMLVRHVRQLWQAKGLIAKGITGKKLGAPLELNPFIADKLGQASRSFSEAQLKEAFLKLADLDYRFKTSRAEAVELESVLIKLCQREI